MSAHPITTSRIPAKPIEPEDFHPSDEADILRQMAERRARWMDADHEQALRAHAAIERERVDPEGVDRERRADRAEARRIEDAAGRR